jgi:hypothetical protein
VRKLSAVDAKTGDASNIVPINPATMSNPSLDLSSTSLSYS